VSIILLDLVTGRAVRRGYAAAGLVVNDLTAVRVLPALDWWASHAGDSSGFQSAPLRLSADVVLAHRAFTLSGDAAFTHPCNVDSPATVSGALTLSGLAGVELTGGGVPVLGEAAVSCDGAFTLSAAAATAAFLELPIGAAAVTVTGHALVPGRGLHSFTFQLNVSAFCGIQGALRVCLGVLLRVFRRCRGVLGDVWGLKGMFLV